MAKKIKKIIKYFLISFAIASVGFFIAFGISTHLPILYLVVGTILLTAIEVIAFRLIYSFMSKYYIPSLYGGDKPKE